MRRVVGLCVAAAILAALWIGYGWLITPQTYQLPIIYACVGVATAVVNVVALRRFHRMYTLILNAEQQGLAEPGATLFSANQRFRYFVRAVESAWVLGLAAIILLEVSNPSLGTQKVIGWFIVSFFIGAPMLTGYLTIRDLHVVNTLRAHDTRAAVELRPFEDT